MTGWKMPEYQQKIYKNIGWSEKDIQEYEISYNLGEIEYLKEQEMLDDLREHNLLSTPAERDEQENYENSLIGDNVKMSERIKAQEKRIKELQKEILENRLRNGNLWCEAEKAERKDRELISAQKKSIAKLKSALDNAEKENNAWVLNEKLKSGGQQKRIEGLEVRVKRTRELLAWAHSELERRGISSYDIETELNKEPPK